MESVGRIRTGGALAVSLGLVLAACGGGDDAEDSSAGSGSSTTQPAGQSSTTGADVDQNAVFRWGYSTGIASMDPIKATSSFQYMFLNPVFDSLVTMEDDGSLSPGIAESWELSEDGTTFTLTLAEGRTFQDGTPIDGAAVKANLERVINDPASTVAEMDIVKSVAADGNTVTLTVADQGGRLPALLSDRGGMMVSPASFTSPELDTKPIGSGPFTLVSASDALVVYKAWDGYHAADEIGPAGIEIVIQPDDNTRLAATRSGELDATFIRPNQVAEAKSAGLDFVTKQVNGVYALSLNTKHPALAQPDVRRAISHAIDREAIGVGVYKDGCAPAVQPYADSYWAYNPDISLDEYGSYDPEQARELLASGGYPDGFEITVAAPSISTYTSLLEVIQAQLAEVGIKVNPVVQESVQWTTSVRQGQFDAWVHPIETSRPDVFGFYQLQYLPGGAFNPGGYSPPGMAELYEQAADVADTDEQAPIVHKMMAAALDDGARVVTVCVPDTNLVTTDRIHNLAVPVNGNYSFRTITESAE
jgi:peptide/nickel transport system substrate-binding protein